MVWLEWLLTLTLCWQAGPTPTSSHRSPFTSVTIKATKQSNYRCPSSKLGSPTSLIWSPTSKGFSFAGLWGFTQQKMTHFPSFQGLLVLSESNRPHRQWPCTQIAWQISGLAVLSDCRVIWGLWKCWCPGPAPDQLSWISASCLASVYNKGSSGDFVHILGFKSPDDCKCFEDGEFGIPSDFMAPSMLKNNCSWNIINLGIFNSSAQ